MGYRVQSIFKVAPDDQHAYFIYFVPGSRITFDWINGQIDLMFDTIADRLNSKGVIVGPTRSNRANFIEDALRISGEEFFSKAYMKFFANSPDAREFYNDERVVRSGNPILILSKSPLQEGFEAEAVFLDLNWFNTPDELVLLIDEVILAINQDDLPNIDKGLKKNSIAINVGNEFNRLLQKIAVSVIGKYKNEGGDRALTEKQFIPQPANKTELAATSVYQKDTSSMSSMSSVPYRKQVINNFRKIGQFIVSPAMIAVVGIIACAGTWMAVPIIQPWFQQFTQTETPPIVTSPIVTSDPLSSEKSILEFRIGLLPGHNQKDVGAICPDGLSEQDVNREIANKVQELLNLENIYVDILVGDETTLKEYNGSLILSIHVNSCEYINDQATGYKALIPRSRENDASIRLYACISSNYQQETGLRFLNNSYSTDMLLADSFDMVNPSIPVLVLEAGFLNLDRAILTEKPDLIGKGIAKGIICYLNNQTASFIKILDVLDMGTFNERVLLEISGDKNMNLSGWILSDKQGNTYSLPEITQTDLSTLDVYTRNGGSSSNKIFLNLPQPVWQEGRTISLFDTKGKEVAAFTIERK